MHANKYTHKHNVLSVIVCQGFYPHDQNLKRNEFKTHAMSKPYLSTKNFYHIKHITLCSTVFYRRVNLQNTLSCCFCLVFFNSHMPHSKRHSSRPCWTVG